MSEPVQEPSSPEPAPPDAKNWSWVLERRCPECGYEASTIETDRIPDLIRDAARRFGTALEAPDAGVRPAPRTWSTVEYGQHVADVLEVMTRRLGLILDSGGAGAEFPDWDQDAAAVEKEYWLANAHVTAILIKERAAAAAEAWAEPSGEQWDWPGTRGDGTQFTAATLGRYLVHELVHHLHDVEAGAAAPGFSRPTPPRRADR